MNKTIKVIDLYNRIAVRKDIPKKIKYDGLIYNWDEDCYLHYSDGIAMEHSFLEGKKTEMLLNDEVEIIEESEQDIDKTTTKHVMIDEENLKNLIRNNYRWEDYTLQGKIDIVTSLAYFDNNNDLIDFIKYVGV